MKARKTKGAKTQSLENRKARKRKKARRKNPSVSERKLARVNAPTRDSVWFCGQDHSILRLDLSSSSTAGPRIV